MWQYVIMAVLVVASYLLRPKPATTVGPTPGELEATVVDSSSPVPVLFGTRLISTANCVWYGDVRVYALEDHDQVIGHRYYSGLHLVFCHGADELIRIKVGDKWAWGNIGELTEAEWNSVQGSGWWGTSTMPTESPIAENTQIQITRRKLFGGDGGEGGIEGDVDVCFGLPAQTQNSYLQGKLGVNIPAFRGLFSLIAHQCLVACNNPYIKPWSALLKRTKIGWRDDIGSITASDGYVDMNPAHIIFEALTNTTWGGLGYPITDIDMDSFEDAAYTLFVEGFGLSLVWAKDTSIEDFLNVVLGHIDGVLFFSHVTGLLTLKLVRNDYSAPMLPVVDESSVIELNEYTMGSSSEAINQVIVKWVDRANQPQVTTVQDIAGVTRAGGQIVSTTVEMPGIADKAWSHKIAARELQQLAMPLGSCEFYVNRKHWGLEPGDCFRFTWPTIGLDSVVMRVTSLDIGVLDDSKIMVKAARDVYGLGPISITAPAESMWSNPSAAPADVTDKKIGEMTWWQFVRKYGTSSAVLSELDDASTRITVVCRGASSDSINFELWARNVGSSTYTKKATSTFPFVGYSSAAVGPEVESILTIQGSIDRDLVAPGAYAFLGDEIVSIAAIDLVNGTVTVDRGVCDTIPIDHPAGETIWFCGTTHALDETDRAVGEQVEIKLLSATPNGMLDIVDADLNTYTCVGRMMRPYPPGNVRINGNRWPLSIGAAEELALTWAHRDRTTQTVSLVRQDVGDIGPEAGVSYTLRIYGETDTLLREVTGLTGTSFTYAAATEQADSGFVPARLNTALRIELESVQGSLVSFQKWNLTVTRT